MLAPIPVGKACEGVKLPKLFCVPTIGESLELEAEPKASRGLDRCGTGNFSVSVDEEPKLNEGGAGLSVGGVMKLNRGFGPVSLDSSIEFCPLNGSLLAPNSDGFPKLKVPDCEVCVGVVPDVPHLNGAWFPLTDGCPNTNLLDCGVCANGVTWLNDVLLLPGTDVCPNTNLPD
jgi:hypothetical protein